MIGLFVWELCYPVYENIYSFLITFQKFISVFWITFQTFPCFVISTNLQTLPHILWITFQKYECFVISTELEFTRMPNIDLQIHSSLRNSGESFEISHFWARKRNFWKKLFQKILQNLVISRHFSSQFREVYAYRSSLLFSTWTQKRRRRCVETGFPPPKKILIFPN